MMTRQELASLVNVDDYVGPQHPQVMGDMGYVNTITQLASVRCVVSFGIGFVTPSSLR